MYDWKFKISAQGWTNWEVGHDGWDSGSLRMPEFVAELFMQAFITDIRIIFNGYIYYKSYDKRYSRRYAVTLAKKFGKEIVEQAKGEI